MNARSSVHGSFRHSEDVARAKARPCLPNVEGLDLVYFVTWAEGLLLRNVGRGIAKRFTCHGVEITGSQAMRIGKTTR
jgi:enoyl-CoA hydratase/carnithine racemase